ncbi:hemerythrin domain-containing protein [Azospirillum sp.]|uniref:hemerythrin domain-containing protein n=1 Tax=Azospirillum sp. TaxID=34012 RepID=UPI002D44A7F3|nr:hemerythrin domain-containing protein [Azospirillum sp.]HYD65721.1 hemerythrin domain-containing protein [Azospirillum sp.]
MHVGLRLIRDEHRTLAAVVDGLSQVAKEMAAKETASGRAKPDFALLDAIIAYIEGFPGQLHHPKEDSVLFPAVQRRTHDLDAVIAELHRQHDEDYRRVGALREALAQWRAGADAGEGAAFAEQAAEYARFTMRHIAVEETQILHALPTLLTAEDWAEIDGAFDANQDPMTAPGLADDFRRLFQRIVLLAPAPLGLGGAPGGS